MDAQNIDLLEPVTVMGERVEALRFRAPRGRDLVAGGDIETWVRMPDNSLYSIDNTQAIRRYAKALIMLPDKALFDGGDVFDALELPDALRVKAKIAGFFSEADRAITLSESKPSSSTSAS